MAMGGGILTRGKAKSSSISAVITRADGTIENLGIVAYWHRNPLKRLLVNLYIWIKDKKHGRQSPE